MNNSRVPFSKTQEQNQETLKGIVTQIENLEEKIPDLNKQVEYPYLKPAILNLGVTTLLRVDKFKISKLWKIKLQFDETSQKLRFLQGNFTSRAGKTIFGLFVFVPS